MKNIVTILTLIIALIILSSSTIDPEDKKGNFYNDIFYEIWVKSFADSDDPNEIGDIQGIIQKLDYLNDGDPKTKNDLGITAIKLSPIFECGYKSENPAANMHGYDIVDYYAVNDIYGKKDDVAELIKQSHERGIKVIFDFVPNHTSNVHPWFLNAKEKGSKRNWYIWNNNPDPKWRIPWGGGEWNDVWKKHGSEYYYSAYQFETLPDLNYKNEMVRDEMLNIAKYWLDFGFDGIRIDAPRYLVEDGPGKVADRPGTHSFFKELRKLSNEYSSPKLLVAETWASKEIIKEYYGNGNNELHMCFDFPFAYKVAGSIHNNDVSSLRELIHYQQANFPKQCRTATLLANHDNINPRPYSLFNNDPQRAVLAAAFNILSTGVPFIYYGDEIGLEGKKGEGQDQDIQLRQAFNWQVAENQQNDPNSILSWYRYLITARKRYSAIHNGDLHLLEPGDKSVLAYMRSNEEQNLLFVFNTSDQIKSITLDLSFLSTPSIKISPILGDVSKDVVLYKPEVFPLNNIPAYSFLLIFIGDEPQDKIAGFSGRITGGAKPPQLTKHSYSTMFLRGNLNDGNEIVQMAKNKKGVWCIILDLKPGVYDYKFEIGGSDAWDINWGDSDKDGFGDIDGAKISLEVIEAGQFEFQFNEIDYSYFVELRQ